MLMEHYHHTGLAVLCDIILTTHFLTLVMLTVWKLALPIPFLFYVLVIPIEVTYLSASLNKIPVGTLLSQLPRCTTLDTAFSVCTLCLLLQHIPGKQQNERLRH